MEQTADENQYQAPNPKATSPSNVRAAGAERKWQLISLVTGILFIMAVAIVVWLALDISAAGTLQSKLESENQSLREQLNIAGTQITGLKNDMETLLTENAKLKSQTVSPAAVASRQSLNRNHLASLSKRIDEKTSSTLNKAIPYFSLSLALLLMFVSKVGSRVSFVTADSPDPSGAKMWNPLIQIPVAIT